MRRLNSHHRGDFSLPLRGGAVLAGALLCLAFLDAERLPAAAFDQVEMEVSTVAFDHESSSPVVVLQDKAGQKALPIWVGSSEAQAIAMEIQGVSGPRPFTHDLMKRIVEELGGNLVQIVIDDLRGHTYYATIHLLAGSDRIRIDSRPSDAIALALRFRKPILVNAALLASEGVIDLTAVKPSVDVAQLWGLTLQDVNEELAELFELGEAHGVLVSNVGRGAAAASVERGDVITEMNGEALHRLAELKSRADGLQGGAQVHLGLTRRGAHIRVHFAADER
jgi:bifunctional DNase/RNase